ncbi:MAG: hypothetical protein IPG12_13045 [Saprospiraceae bacterium]|nr:hypothetical protein [Saprospiraceae bacterium]
MNPIFKLYLKSFGFFFIAFMLVDLMLWLLFGKIVIQTKIDLLSSLFLSSIFTYYTYNNLKKLGIERFTNQHFKLSQFKIIPYTKTLKDAFLVIKNNSFMDGKNGQLLDQKIEIESYESTASWGEIICIKFCGQLEMNTLLEISSKPRFRFQCFDWGQNRTNVEMISKLLLNQA